MKQVKVIEQNGVYSIYTTSVITDVDGNKFESFGDTPVEIVTELELSIREQAAQNELGRIASIRAAISDYNAANP